MTRVLNPDLSVGEGNKQLWNQPDHRRHGFHNVHKMFRRALMLRAEHQLLLTPKSIAQLRDSTAFRTLTGRPEFSALVCARGADIVLEQYAPDMSADRPHSIQSITKLFMHVIAGRLIKADHLDTTKTVENYIPEIGTGYRGSSVQDVLDMNVMNDFVEDYSDPYADSFAEEVALGWRLPPEGTSEISMREFVVSIGGSDLTNSSDVINYCSANTDLLTLICDRILPGQLPDLLMDVVEASGLAGALHISLSPERLPAFSGGGCLSPTDLARFGLFLAALATGEVEDIWNSDLLVKTRDQARKTLHPPRDTVRYANQMMTNGHWVGHAGYGGQFLLVDTRTGLSCAYLSVLENDSGYDEHYMFETINNLQVLADSFTTA